MNENNQIPFIQTPGPSGNSFLMILLLIIVVVGGAIGLAAWIGDPIKVGAVFGAIALSSIFAVFFFRHLAVKDMSAGADARGQVDAANTNLLIGLMNAVLPLIGNQGSDHAKTLQQYNDALAQAAAATRNQLEQTQEAHRKELAEMRKMIGAALPAPQTLEGVSRETLASDEDEVPAQREPVTQDRMPDEWEYRFKDGRDTARGDIMHAIVYWFDENEKPSSPWLDRRTAVRKCSGLSFKNGEYTDALQALDDAGIVEGVGSGAKLRYPRTEAITKLAEIRLEQFQRWGVLK